MWTLATLDVNVVARRKTGVLMDLILLKEYAVRLRDLIDSAPPSSREAAFLRSYDFIQAAIDDAIHGRIEGPRDEQWVTRWMLENSDLEDKEFHYVLSAFQILLRGWKLPT